MGGIMKGGYGHMHAAYSSRRRWINEYVVMVIVCLLFGCGILGLMGLHRERRILNLLIKEKDDQILSLHRLLQKEREHMQEVEWKTEEMKMKIFSLRAQKTELNGRVMDMQSTISALRHEQRTIELALQEKQNEVKLLREQYTEVKDQNPQVKALTEVLQQREAEIEDLKHRLQLRGAEVGSESTNEHSIISGNTTPAKANMSRNETMMDENKDRDMPDDKRKNPADDMESTRNNDWRNGETESSMQSDERRENGRLITEQSEITSKEEFDSLDNPQERSAENGTNADRSDQVGSSETGAGKKEYEIEKTGGLQNEEQEPRDEDTAAQFTGSKEFSATGDTHSRRISKSQSSDNQELHKGLVKLEMQENSHGGHYRFRGKHGYLKRAKGKRWRPIAKQTEGKRISRSNGVSTMGDQGLVEGVEEIGNKSKVQNESVPENQQFEIDGKLPDAAHGEAMLDVKGHTEEYNGEKSEDSTPGIRSQNIVKPADMSHTVAKFDASNQFENGREVPLTNSSSLKSHISQDEVPKHPADKSEDTESSNEGAVNHTEEDEQSKEQEISATEHAENKNDGQPNNRLGRKEAAETDEDPDRIQMEHFEESELGEDSEDKEQTDEPAF